MHFTERTKTSLIGTLVLGACILMIWGLVYLNPSLGDARKIVKVRFANIDKVSVGTRVSYAGRPAGQVIAIEPITEPRLAADSGPVYAFELTMAIDSGITVYSTDQFAVHTAGLLGERSVAIVPKRPKPGVPLVEVTGNEILYSSPGASVEDTFSGLSTLAQKAEVVLDQISRLLETNGDDVTGVIASMKGTFVRLNAILEDADDEKLVATFNEACDALSRALDALDKGGFYVNASKSVEELQAILGAVNQPENLAAIVVNTQELTKGFADAAGRAGEIADNFAEISSDVLELWPKITQTLDDVSMATRSVRTAADRLVTSEGTIGKLLNDDALYVQTRGILSKMETLMDDINHYGILFHLDRSWQRQRTRRANVLAELSTSSQFRDYFREEMASIDTSLSRVSTLLERAESGGCRQEFLEDREFTKAFNELLRRVEGVEERLKMYNEQVCNQVCNGEGA